MAREEDLEGPNISLLIAEHQSLVGFVPGHRLLRPARPREVSHHRILSLVARQSAPLRPSVALGISTRQADAGSSGAEHRVIAKFFRLSSLTSRTVEGSTGLSGEA